MIWLILLILLVLIFGLGSILKGAFWLLVILALIGLRAREAVIARSREIVASNLALLDDFFARRAEAFTWVRPRGGSTGFPRLVAGGPPASGRERRAARASTAIATPPMVRRRRYATPSAMMAA